MTLQLFLATSFAMGLPVAVFLLGRKRTLAELKDARDLGRSMLENMREVIFRTDRDGRWAFVNPAWHDLTGYTVEESIGRPTHELVHPDDLGAAVDLHRRLVAGEIDEAVIEQRFYTAAKVCRSIQANIRALRDEAGAFVGTVGNIRDVTDQQAAERALEESRQLFDTIATLSPLGIVRRGLDGSLAYCNPTWLRFAGVTAEQAYSKIWASTIHEDDRERIKTEWKAAIAARASYRTEFRYIRPDGMTWVDSIAAPDLSFDGELIGFVAVLVDITERKSLEEALVGARRHAEAGALAKSSFLANMSHEIRTPMTGVLGFADVLLNSPLDDDQRRFAQMIADSGREMMRLLNDILDLSKIEAGHMRLAKEPVDIGHMLNRCIRLMTVNAQGKGVGLRLEIEPGIPAVTGDSQRLRQIVLNLIGNALKFTDRGDVVVRALMSEDDGAGQRLTIEVEDTGIGIGEEQREAIFHPFDQGDTLTARKFGGTGLGLTICRELASAMGGEMSVESEVGRGSRFRFSMPVEASGRLPAPMLALPSVTGDAADVPRVQPLSVLLAEDLDINQLLLTTVLNRLGHAVELATDGADAIRRVERAAAEGRLFDIVLMDIQMPEVDGLAATRAIRGLGFDAAALPIVALTANAFAEDVAACLAAGMQDHLMKPLSRPALEAALTRWARPSVRLASTDCSAASQVDPELYGRYAKRKAALLHRIDAMIRDGRFDDDEAGGLASDLHKLAGVAAMFGEPEVGALAATLERNIVDWTEAEREAQLAGVAQELLKAA
ncbi:MAG: PAS domain S-box protein [Sphingomicrobium sp.]